MDESTRSNRTKDPAAPETVEWEKLAPGVWRARFGDVSRELSYTSLAVRPPLADALGALPESPFPFSGKPVSFRRYDDRMIHVAVPTEPGEEIHGLGLQLGGTLRTGEALNLAADHWGGGEGRTHAPVPFFVSSRGYGVLFNTARFLKVHVQCTNRTDSPNNPAPVDRNPPPGDESGTPWMAVPASDAVEAHLSARGIEVLAFSGESPLDAVSRYNLFCGGGAMPPLWGLGFWHRVRADYDAAQSEREVREFEEHRVPLDVLGLEPGWMSRSYPCTFEWQKKRFPDPGGFVRGMLERGVRLNLWFNPYVSPEARIHGELLPFSGSHMVWLGIVPDYTVPAARAALCRQFAEDHLGIGVGGYKVDEVDGFDRWLWPDHASFPSGTPAEAMRQVYGLLMQNLLHKDLFHPRNTRTWSLVRSSNAGGSGFPFVLYSDSYNHAEYIAGISSASLSGVLWCPEVRQARSAAEWLARIQTVCFSPLAMLDAWESGTKPWEFPEAAGAVRSAIELRMRLLPYLYTAFADYNRKGTPPFRAMVLERGRQAAGAEGAPAKVDGQLNPYGERLENTTDDQFMFGPSILAAPYFVDSEGALQPRRVRLPEGDWYDFHTGEFAGNGTTIVVETPERMPLFVKGGAIIPMLTKAIANSRGAFGHPLEARLYGRGPGTFELYEDDGTSYDHERGAFRERVLVFEGGKGSESIRGNGPAMFGPVERWVDTLREGVPA
jgi:alpha-glucosidase (family GH31 glycosyl hydrolase)